VPKPLPIFQQGEAFYETARGRTAAHPLLHYYAILNVGKALLLVRGFKDSLEKAHHGLIDLSAGTAAPERVRLQVADPKRTPKRPHVFRELIGRLGYDLPQPGTTYVASELMAQVVIGHRLWREATHRAERFVVIEQLQFVHNPTVKQVWLRLFVSWETMQSHGMNRGHFKSRADLPGAFSIVEDSSAPDDWLCLEQQASAPYAQVPVEGIMGLVEMIRPSLWRIVSAVPGTSYRRYYLYLSPPKATRTSQIAAAWVLLYYLGSVVRYRPHRFHTITNGRFGPFVDEFISVQTEQLLYLFASEMCRREIARPAIV
jgi:hypothetical protein